MQIATAVVQALNDDSVVDAIQLIRAGWWIYLKANADRERLVQRGLTVAGKFVCHSEFTTRTSRSVKITVKDLPLHYVDNAQVLETFSQICTILSPVQYGTLWYNGQSTSICNGDRFFYVPEAVVGKIPMSVKVGEYKARVFRPAALMQCVTCDQMGHKALDSQCLALAPQDIMDMVETFRGGKNPLSNLHNCPEGCGFNDGQHEFHSSEQHYQFQWLRHYGKVEESYTVLESESGVEAMCLAHEILLEMETHSDWWEQAMSVMTDLNRKKYQACEHAHEVLLDSNVVLVKATSNVFWGSGLNPERTLTTLSDYWPGKNHMGKLLVCLHDKFMQIEDDSDQMDGCKRKASSPLQAEGQKQNKQSEPNGSP